MESDQKCKPAPQDRSSSINDSFLSLLEHRQQDLVKRMTETQYLIDELRKNQQHYLVNLGEDEGINDDKDQLRAGSNDDVSIASDHDKSKAYASPLHMSSSSVKTPRATDRTGVDMAELYSYLSISQDMTTGKTSRHEPWSLSKSNLNVMPSKLHDNFNDEDSPMNSVNHNENGKTHVQSQDKNKEESAGQSSSPKYNDTCRMNDLQQTLDRNEVNQNRDISDIIGDSIIRGSIEAQDKAIILSLMDKVVSKLHHHLSPKINNSTCSELITVDKYDSSASGKDTDVIQRKNLRRRNSTGKHSHKIVADDAGEMGDIDTDPPVNERPCQKDGIILSNLFTKWNKVIEGQQNTQLLQSLANENPSLPLDNPTFEDMSNGDAGEEGDVDSDYVAIGEKKSRDRLTK